MRGGEKHKHRYHEDPTKTRVKKRQVVRKSYNKKSVCNIWFSDPVMEGTYCLQHQEILVHMYEIATGIPMRV
jgi:hypothetical protein